jgi:hypothetical protein
VSHYYAAMQAKQWAIRVGSSLAFVLPACSALVDVDDYEFVTVPESPSLSLEPGADAGKPVPTRPAPSEPPPVNAGGAGGTAGAGGGSGMLPVAQDAGISVGGGPGVVVPPPVLPRPVVVAAPPGELVALAGNPTGGQPRTAICTGGVLGGLFFQYFTSVALSPERLSYVWPLCNTLEPGTTNLLDGEGYDATFPDGLEDDPVFTALRDNEAFDVVTCPIDQYVVGISGSHDPVGASVGIRSLNLECAPLLSNPEQSDVAPGAIGVASAAGIAPAPGVTPFEQVCPPGTVASQLDLRFGSWLDALGLRCSAVRWPFTAGHACSAGAQCQSGSCDIAGVCAP